MGKITGFLEIERRERPYEKVEKRLKSWREFVLPSKQTCGASYRFSVYLDKVFEAASNNLVSQSFTIKNNSAGASCP
jgi:hypothetical protein